MVVQMIRAALSLVGGTRNGREGGMWHTIRTWVEGKNAATFERERRTTLLSAPLAIQQGGRVYDKRADGSVLEIVVPTQERLDVIAGESVRRDGAVSAPSELLPARPAALTSAEEK
ncbi:hypothetical protein [Streptomyces nitrosporeus]|uniref:hypothetical protein n=1 Tax=Streptomyces nitrosporeus TaxID=28894 RepID=UPI00167D7EFB|nr:hypothetical protein [Streptomyces nitrosporeus]GGZ29086.1 hypothetical protein GCM10010327_69280 [Streptomyces nitrosporeus]